VGGDGAGRGRRVPPVACGERRREPLALLLPLSLELCCPPTFDLSCLVLYFCSDLNFVLTFAIEEDRDGGGWRAAFVREATSQTWWRYLGFAPHALPCKRLSCVPPTPGHQPGTEIRLVPTETWRGVRVCGASSHHLCARVRGRATR
jgi:hypothetical protein